MFEKYTEKARRTIFFARYEVSELGGHAIEPEHLLLGFLREDKSLLQRLLRKEVRPVRATLRQRLQEHSRLGNKISTAVEIPLSAEAKEVLRKAAEESAGMGHRHIGTEHLLLGLVKVEGTFAAGVLEEHKIGYDEVRAAIKEMHGE